MNKTDGPYKLILNDLIVAKVRAVNSLGAGLFSAENVASVTAAKVKTNPDTPTLPPTRVET